ncbi:MAG: NTP transferase domain-containing protein [Kofleriaceae bacterium]|jgi:mannose-1-phosphate guanylyltransferase|nr:NTP transferase domain-containing protein [Kofleriaceae bacterium]
MKILAVVMAGGYGTRLAPWSTEERPKQFRSLIATETMLQLTVERASRFADRVVVVTRTRWKQMATEQLAHLRADVVCLEDPPGTGYVMALACTMAFGDNKDVVVALPADHAVDEDTYTFPLVCREAAIVAGHTGQLVAIGVEPTRPDPGLGYIVPAPTGLPAVAGFAEKPSADQAAALIQAGALWNTGVYAVRAARWFLLPHRPNERSIDKGCAEPSAMHGLMAAVRYPGRWSDIGTLESLNAWKVTA